jgi:hypothetical protein
MTTMDNSFRFKADAFLMRAIRLQQGESRYIWGEDRGDPQRNPPEINALIKTLPLLETYIRALTAELRTVSGVDMV